MKNNHLFFIFYNILFYSETCLYPVNQNDQLSTVWTTPIQSNNNSSNDSRNTTRVEPNSIQTHPFDSDDEDDPHELCILGPRCPFHSNPNDTREIRQINSNSLS